MAELLIKLTNATHSDPVKDLRGCYKRGDVVCVMPDGHQWGAKESPPDFMVLQVPDMTTEEAQAYLQPVVEPVTEESVLPIALLQTDPTISTVEVIGGKTMITRTKASRRRRFSFDMTGLSHVARRNKAQLTITDKKAP